MNKLKWYHGSPHLFDEFKNDNVNFVSPHYAYAEQYAFKDDNEIGYIYEVEIKNEEPIEHNIYLSNTAYKGNDVFIMLRRIKLLKIKNGYNKILEKHEFKR